MAKSLKSKWKRKMRAIKRIRYGQKELDRLKKMLEEAKDKNEDDIDVKFVTVDAFKESADQASNSNADLIEPKVDESESDNDAADNDPSNYADAMSMDGDLKLIESAKNTNKSKEGKYPIWFSTHRIKKIKKLKKQAPKKKIKQLKKLRKQRLRSLKRH